MKQNPHYEKKWCRDKFLNGDAIIKICEIYHISTTNMSLWYCYKMCCTYKWKFNIFNGFLQYVHLFLYICFRLFVSCHVLSIFQQCFHNRILNKASIKNENRDLIRTSRRLTIDDLYLSFLFKTPRSYKNTHNTLYIHQNTIFILT